MRYIYLPDDKTRKLPFYLAMEEFLAVNTQEEAIFMWQVDPTVIFGRNQSIEKEVNLEYCREHGIQFYRRKSGGGCVYADRSNIMFSFITTAYDIPATFAYYTGRLAGMLRELGLDATSSGRNDVTISGRKVSGNAFYQIGDRSIVHGTMLYNTDIVNMAKAISPSPTKLSSKGVDSVRSHITTLQEEGIGLNIEEFKCHARTYLCDGEIALSTNDVATIERMAQPYYQDSWIYGNNPRSDVKIERHIDGVGEFQIHITLKNDKIKDIIFAGDYFLLAPVDLLAKPLVGTTYNRGAVSEKINTIDPSGIIKGLSREELMNLLF